MNIFKGCLVQPFLLMKNTLLLILFACFSTSLFATPVFVKVIDANGRGIPYVTISNADGRLYTFTDSLGERALPDVEPAYGDLTFSRIGFATQAVAASEEDTMYVVMQAEGGLLDEVVISQQKIDRRKLKVKEAGDHRERARSFFILYQKAKLGYAIRGLPISTNPRYLRSVFFRLDKPGNLKKKDFVLELKIYPIQNGDQIGKQPLNTQPIFVKASDLGKKNEVDITEDLVIPADGIFISLELPDYFDKSNETKIVFVGSNKASHSNQFMVATTKDWDRNLLRKKYEPFPFSKRTTTYSTYNFGISYYE